MGVLQKFQNYRNVMIVAPMSSNPDVVSYFGKPNFISYQYFQFNLSLVYETQWRKTC